MHSADDRTIQPFIGWKDEYNSQVSIIDHQHRGILHFINTWYNEVKAKGFEDSNLVEYMQSKFAYLDYYSKAHLKIEEKMLDLLARDHGFPQAEYQRHLSIHNRFIKEFMGSMASQLAMLSRTPDTSLMEELATGGLQDVARWWYSHIKTPSEKAPAGPDHIYRVYLEQLPAEAKVHLLNDMILFFENATVNTAAINGEAITS